MCRCLVKFILFAVNLIFLLIGLLVVASGVFLIFQLKNTIVVTDHLPAVSLDFIPYVIITLGVIVFLISFSGCCGTITETQCLLITYAVCMGLLAAAKIVLSILLFVNLRSLTNTVETTINDMFLSEDPYQNATFHILEYQLKCCGTTGPDAYVNEYNLVSPTCCEQDSSTFPLENLPIDLQITNLTTNHIQEENTPVDLTNLPADLGNVDLGGTDLENLGNLTVCKREDAYQTGCTALITKAVKEFGRTVGFVLIGVVAFEVLAMSISIYLIKSKKPKHPPPIYYQQQPRYYY